MTKEELREYMDISNVRDLESINKRLAVYEEKFREVNVRQ